MVIIIVASHSEAKGKFGVEGLLFRVHAQSSWGGGRVNCPALSKTADWKEQQYKCSQHILPSLPWSGCASVAGMFMFISCSCSGVAEGNWSLIRDTATEGKDAELASVCLLRLTSLSFGFIEPPCQCRMPVRGRGWCEMTGNAFSPKH